MADATATRKDRVSRAEKAQALYAQGAVSLREREIRPLPDGRHSSGVLAIESAVYEVEASDGGSYRVEYDAADRQRAFRCGCPDALLREAECKHAIAARLDLNTRARKLRAATEIEVAREEAERPKGFDI